MISKDNPFSLSLYVCDNVAKQTLKKLFEEEYTFLRNYREVTKNLTSLFFFYNRPTCTCYQHKTVKTCQNSTEKNLFMKQQFEKLKSVLGMPGACTGTLRTPA